MIVKLQYDGWQYFEGEEISVKYGQSFLSVIEDDMIVLVPDLPPKVDKDMGVTVINIINGSNSKTILIPYNDLENKVIGYLLNNEGKTIDKI